MTALESLQRSPNPKLNLRGLGLGDEREGGKKGRKGERRGAKVPPALISSGCMGDKIVYVPLLA